MPQSESDFRVQDTSGNAAESFTGHEVTNSTAGQSSDQPDPPGSPGGLGVSANDSGKLDLAWNAPGSN